MKKHMEPEDIYNEDYLTDGYKRWLEGLTDEEYQAHKAQRATVRDTPAEE
jgi:hypothetical protein